MSTSSILVSPAQHHIQIPPDLVELQRDPAFQLPDPLGRIGDLELQLTRKAKDVKRAQKLRYKVFFEEMSAVPNVLARIARRDVDIFDQVCDHLLVRDRAPRPGFIQKKPRTVGTYRLLRQEIAERHFGFYTQGEFDIAPLIAEHAHLNFLELGRSCVLAPWRDRRTVELLWHGIWAYVLAHKVDVMIGCASLEGTNTADLALPLSYLHHFHRAPDAWRAEALPERRAKIPLLPKAAIDPKAALRALPPLIKGYLRLGAMIGEGAVVDHQFGTTDVLIVLPRAFINPRYIQYYGADATRHAA
jgi:putative hemolysin